MLYSICYKSINKVKFYNVIYAAQLFKFGAQNAISYTVNQQKVFKVLTTHTYMYTHPSLNIHSTISPFFAFVPVPVDWRLQNLWHWLAYSLRDTPSPWKESVNLHSVVSSHARDQYGQSYRPTYLQVFTAKQSSTNLFTSGTTGLQKPDEERQNWERSTGISLNREGLWESLQTYFYCFISKGITHSHWRNNNRNKKW